VLGDLNSMLANYGMSVSPTAPPTDTIAMQVFGDPGECDQYYGNDVIEKNRCLCDNFPDIALGQGIDCSPYTPIYWYHPDYIGNVEFVTDRTGQPYQHFYYAAFGDPMVSQHVGTGSFNSAFRFNAKEYDEETGNYYYGARYFEPKSSVWMGVDALATKYPGMNPYNFVMGNPIMAIDPDGNDVDSNGIDWTRVGGGVQWILGSFEAAAGVTSVYFGNPWGSAVYANGMDNLWTGYNTMITGEPTPTILNQAIQSVGVSEENAGLVEFGINAAVGGMAYKYIPPAVSTDVSMPVLQIDDIGRMGSKLDDAALGGSKIAIQFGKTENQVYHAFRHTDALGLDRSLVQSTIQNHFKTVSSQVVSGQPFNQIIEIGGHRIQYTAFELSENTFNIGRIHGVN
jgi:RHS repeat-associated protein